MRTVKLSIRVRPASAKQFEKVAKIDGYETLSAWIRHICLDRVSEVEAKNCKELTR